MSRDTLCVWVSMAGLCAACGQTSIDDEPVPEPADAGEPSVELVSTDDDCAWLGVAATEGIYFQSGDDIVSRSIRMLPRDGGPSVEIGAGAARWMESDGEHVYWLDPFDEVLWQAPIGGGGTPVVVDTDVRRAAIDAENLYWITTAGALTAVPKAGGNATVLAEDENLYQLVANHTGVYVSALDGKIERIDPVTGASELLLWTARVTSMAIAGMYLYAYVDEGEGEGEGEGDLFAVIGLRVDDAGSWVALSDQQDDGYLQADFRGVYLVTPAAAGAIAMPHGPGPISALHIGGDSSIQGLSGDGWAIYACDGDGDVLRVEGYTPGR